MGKAPPLSVELNSPLPLNQHALKLELSHQCHHLCHFQILSLVSLVRKFLSVWSLSSPLFLIHSQSQSAFTEGTTATHLCVPVSEGTFGVNTICFSNSADAKRVFAHLFELCYLFVFLICSGTCIILHSSYICLYMKCATVDK